MLYQNHKMKLLITSILFLLLGIAIMVYPANSMIILVRITGAFLILLGGLLFIPTYRDRKELGIRFGLLMAVIIIIAVFGIILLVMPDVFVKVFWITMGIILILDGIKNFMYLSAVPYKAATIIMAVLSVICGVLILINPFGTGLAYTILIGAFYAYSGASGVFLNIAGRIMKKYGDEEFQVVGENEADAEDPDADVIMIDTTATVEEAEPSDQATPNKGASAEDAKPAEKEIKPADKEIKLTLDDEVNSSDEG